MPKYKYKCADCMHIFTIIHSITDDSIVCEKCGKSNLEHEIAIKLENHYDPSDLLDWYYSSDDECDEEKDLYSKMQLIRTRSGNLKFNEKYEFFCYKY